MKDDWTFAESSPDEKLARLHQFSLVKKEGERQIEFVITVHEYCPSEDQSMRFCAQADKQTNQKMAPYTPTGWGHTLSKALSECVKEVNRFPYEGD